MRKNILWLAVTVAAALIQMTWLSALQIQGVKPDLVLLLVVFFAITDGEERAMFTGLLGGLYQDVSANMVLGHHIACNVLVGYLAARIAHRLITEHPAVKAGLVLCASLIQGLVFTAVLYVQNPDLEAFALVLNNVIPRMFYTGLITPIVYFVMSRMFRQPNSIQGVLP